MTFKENIRDTRNAKIADTIKKLKTYGVQALGHDPNLYKEEVEKFGVEYVPPPPSGGAPPLGGGIRVDGIILATLHKQFKEMQLADFAQYFNGTGRGVFIDVKSQFLKEASGQKEMIYKCL